MAGRPTLAKATAILDAHAGLGLGSFVFRVALAAETILGSLRVNIASA